MFKSTVYHGDLCIGEVQIVPVNSQSNPFHNNEIRISYVSPPSERCLPLSVLQTIAPSAVRCKLECKSLTEHSHLYNLHYSCLMEHKTAVVLLENEELHLVAMQSKVERLPCFWCCAAPVGLYATCLGMLNLRCLAIVFDLDETLLVANTLKSFEDRIEFLQRRISHEIDAPRAAGLKAELKRYWDDQALLKQYAENDCVIDNGKCIKIQPEDVPSPDEQAPLSRPIIRLTDRNIILTRINPEIRDTSVLVRLRPAWEDLRSYLIAKGRKRFEVYVCTMAERDYALEMWRLLDPEAHLISVKKLKDRVVCVRSGSRKSLLNVLQNNACHPKLAMVIDDRLSVWDENDQSRVHVVPAFAPYYAPQAEMANAVPVLCVARNVACDVRGGFFKEFDENLLRRIFELSYEDEVNDLPSTPDVKHYLMLEVQDPNAVPIHNKEVPVPEGMSGAEVVQRLHGVDQKLGGVEPCSPFVANTSEQRRESSQQSSSEPSHLMLPLIPRTGLLGAGPREGERPKPELEKRQYPSLHHGQDIWDHSAADLQRTFMCVLTSTGGNDGCLVSEEEATGVPLNKQFHPATEGASDAQYKALHSSSNIADSIVNGKSREPVNHVVSKQNRNNVCAAHPLLSVSQASISNGEVRKPSVVSVEVLHEIGRKCGSRIEFRTTIKNSMDLQFSTEVLFSGEKVGAGTARTRTESHQQAADSALHNLASKYVAYAGLDCYEGNLDASPLSAENGFLTDTNVVPESVELSNKEASCTSEELRFLGNSRLSAVMAGIEELGLSPVFCDHPPVSVMLNEGEHYYQVEIDGQVLGKAIGLTKEQAKLQAAEEALGILKEMAIKQTQNLLIFPRSPQAAPNKRQKEDLLKVLPISRI